MSRTVIDLELDGVQPAESRRDCTPIGPVPLARRGRKA
jgi:hypothetical protein